MTGRSDTSYPAETGGPSDCRLCRQFEGFDADFQHYLRQYIADISPELKVEAAAYEARLAGCRQCDAQKQGICQYCGCFVIVRAIKNSLHCPHPQRQNW